MLQGVEDTVLHVHYLLILFTSHPDAPRCGGWMDPGDSDTENVTIPIVSVQGHCWLSESPCGTHFCYTFYCDNSSWSVSKNPPVSEWYSQCEESFIWIVLAWLILIKMVYVDNVNIHSDKNIQKVRSHKWIKIRKYHLIRGNCWSLTLCVTFWHVVWGLSVGGSASSGPSGLVRPYNLLSLSCSHHLQRHLVKLFSHFSIIPHVT